MTSIFHALSRLILVLCLAVPAHAATEGERYETLLAELAQAPDKAEADRLSGEIWQIWLTAPDEAAQEVLDAALLRRQAYDFAGAINHLNRLVETYPDYAEGWNQRATMFFMIGDFDRSLADVEEVLAREPRHFGALSGKAVILVQQGWVPLAQFAVKEALRHHPFLNERAILSIEVGEEL